MNVDKLESIKQISTAILSLYILLLLGIYYSTLAYLIRLWQGDYSYCYLIPIVICYLIWEKRDELNKTVARVTALEAALTTFANAQIAVAIAQPLFAPLSPAWTALASTIAALPVQGAYNTNIEDTNVTH